MEKRQQAAAVQGATHGFALRILNKGTSSAVTVASTPVAAQLVYFAAGLPVVGEGGPIVVPQDSEVTIARDGIVSVTVAGSSTRISAHRAGNDRVVVSGTIGARAGTVRYQLVVGDPATFTGGAFRAALEEQGIIVDGAVIVVENVFRRLSMVDQFHDDKVDRKEDRYRLHTIIEAAVEVGRPTLFSMIIIIAAHIPIFMCTTKDQETDKVWGMRQGAKAYITKPFTELQLVEVINSLLVPG